MTGGLCCLETSMPSMHNRLCFWWSVACPWNSSAAAPSVLAPSPVPSPARWNLDTPRLPGCILHRTHDNWDALESALSQMRKKSCRSIKVMPAALFDYR